MALIAGWIALGLGIAGGLLLRYGFFDWMHGRDLCAFHRLTGYYCPGCGITRACFAIANGQILRSFLLHPIPPILLVLFFWWLIRTSIYALRKKHMNAAAYAMYQQKNRLWYERLEKCSYFLAALLIVQWLFKILLQLIWHKDWFEMIGRLF